MTMDDDSVLTEVAPCTYKRLPLARVLVSGGRQSGTKTWPTGFKEPLYTFPGGTSGRTKKDDGQRGLGNGRVFLTEREKVSLERYIGVRPTDAQHARKLMKERGLRFEEPGEKISEAIEENLDYCASGDERRGIPPPKFPGWDTFGVHQRPKPFNFEERLALNRQKYAEADRRAAGET